MTVFRLPDLGEGLQEAEIVAWHVGEGDHVVADQPLVSVETEKAVVEVPAPQSGRVTRLFAAVGARLAVGAPLADIDGGERPDPGGIVGELAPPPSAPAPTPTPAAGVRAAPAVRARAKALGIDLATIRGTGPQGAITLADLVGAGPAEVEVGGPGEALRGMRRAMAQRMARFAAEVAPATVTEEADIDNWPGEAPDVTARLVRAIVAGVAAAPGLNAWFDGRTLRLDRRPAIDLGLAVDTEDGLIVPVLRDVARLPAAALRQRIDALKRAAAARRLGPEDLAGPTITLSNFGMIAGLTAALAIVPPQVAILGAGRIHRRVVLAGERPEARRVLPLSLTFDHRAATGGEAARFLRAAVADLERPD